MIVEIPPADLIELTESIAELVTGDRPRAEWCDAAELLEIFAVSHPRTTAANAALRVCDRIRDVLRIVGLEAKPEPVVCAGGQRTLFGD